MTTVSTKPYLLRAIWEWCVDQGFTPYLATLVDENTRVPPGYARDGQIVLNLSPDATGQMQMANDFISFQARFGGAAHSLVIPVANVIAIYARENGQGMAFEPELEAVEGEAEADEEQVGGAVQDIADTTIELRRERSAEPEPPARPPRGSHLKVVK
ncbi:ClpXP protease specificity-enhancing factor [Thauera sp.]|jgi:stringent starvation protein B|uniref:ClpXP protease specificity-enhancing factor n=1 Tax=Thauera sp. TaxID=1905334 RepID=UPI002D045C3B|nr:ClpXP protease specificity-enhancing factor [Thauera sp.]HRO38010.1 ClpXP protease specificity-enhancing factor [Thauera sp.]